jgi:hypothetical protein
MRAAIFTMLAICMAGCDIGVSDAQPDSGADSGSDTDGNPDWAPMESGTEAGLSAVWGSSATDVFAVGEAGTIVHFDGTAWSAMQSGTTDDLEDVFGFGPNDVYAAGGNWHTDHDTGFVLHFDGIAWSEVLNVPADESVRALWGSAPDDLYAFGEDGEIVAYHFDGAQWSALECENAPPGGVDASGTSVGNMVVAGYDGVWLFDGAQWTQSFSEEGYGIFYASWSSSPQDAWVSGMYGVRRYDGEAWSEIDVAKDAIGELGLDEFFDVGTLWGFGPSDVYAVGRLTTQDAEDVVDVYRFDGQSWSALDVRPPHAIGDLWGPAPGELFAVGADGMILHFPDAH